MPQTPEANDGRFPDSPGSATPSPPAAALAEIREQAETVWVGDRAPAIAKVGTLKLRGPEGRVAIVDGCRTPFLKSGSGFQELDVVDLGALAAGELVHRSGIPAEAIDLAIFGTVVAALEAPNLGREVLFRASLPARIPGSSVNLACASSNRALTSGAEAILAGQARVVLTGGAESLSNVPIRLSNRAARRLIELSKAKSLGQRVATLAKVRPRDLKPVPPAIAEHSTGLTMGQSAELMAKENAVSRQAQDEIALMSHQRASAAILEGRFAEQVVPVFPPPGYDRPVLVDNGVRHDGSLETLASLRPAFDRRYGTLTAGNSSPITDGGAAVLVMSEARAQELGVTPLGYIRSWAWAALDPSTQLLQGPAFAAPMALDRAGLKLQDMDLIEMHEAFAAQLLSNLKAFASKRFAREALGRSAPLGEVDLDRLNVNGGSIAIGHPFGATGARVTLQLLFELRRRELELGLITVCAAGGVGFAMVVERS